jgi:hypothetical protein
VKVLFLFELQCFVVCVFSGRPIVKGNANFQYTANVDYQQQQQQQQQQHQHRHSSLISGGGNYSNSVPRSKMTLPAPPANMTPQFNTLMMMHRSPNIRGMDHLEILGRMNES